MKKFFSKKLLISLVLPALFTPVQATPNNNDIEKILAIAPILPEIAARHCDLKDYKKPAAILHLLSDTLNILNKACFFYNHNRQAKITWGKWQPNRALAVNAALTAREMTKWYKHFKTYRDIKKAEAPVDEDEDFWLALQDEDEDDEYEYEEIEVAIEEEEEEEVKPVTQTTQAAPAIKDLSKLAYTWQVVMLPSLKGLTTLALAYSQDKPTNFANEPASFLATAAHSLVTLLDEYTLLTPDSLYKHVLEAALLANTVWFAKELKDYHSGKRSPEQALLDYKDYISGKKKLVVDDNEKSHEPRMCNICFDDEKTNFRHLGCGHSYCKDCLMHVVSDSLQNRATATLKCPDPGCKHHISGNEVSLIADNDTALGNAYNYAGYLERFVQQRGAKNCPTPNCIHVYMNDKHLRVTHSCPECKQQYCENCGGNHLDNAPCVGFDPDDLDWIAKNSKVCPGCSKAVQKNEGCNHMTCKCGHQFCWVCGLSYDHETWGWNKACAC